MMRVIVVERLCQMPLVFKMATPQQSSWYVLQVIEGKVNNTCAICILHTVSLGLVVACEIVWEIHVTQLLQSLSSLTAQHTNSSLVM
jgi:hypothetical protein